MRRQAHILRPYLSVDGGGGGGGELDGGAADGARKHEGRCARRTGDGWRAAGCGTGTTVEHPLKHCLLSTPESRRVLLSISSTEEHRRVPFVGAGARAAVGRGRRGRARLQLNLHRCAMPKAESRTTPCARAVPAPACMRCVPTGVRRLLPAARPVLCCPLHLSCSTLHTVGAVEPPIPFRPPAHQHACVRKAAPPRFALGARPSS